MSNFIPKFTSFGTVSKQAQEKLSHIEFNEIANQLADQGNHNAEALVDVFQYQSTATNSDTQQNQRLDSHDTRLNNLDAQVQTVREETAYHDALAETRNKMQDGRLDTSDVRLNTTDERVNNVRERLAKTEDIVAGLQDSVIGGIFPNGSVEDKHLSNTPGQIKSRVAVHNTDLADLKTQAQDLLNRIQTWEDFNTNGGHIANGSIYQDNKDFIVKADADNNLVLGVRHGEEDTTLVLTDKTIRPTSDSANLINLGTRQQPFKDLQVGHYNVNTPSGFTGTLASSLVNGLEIRTGKAYFGSLGGTDHTTKLYYHQPFTSATIVVIPIAYGQTTAECLNVLQLGLSTNPERDGFTITSKRSSNWGYGVHYIAIGY